VRRQDEHGRAQEVPRPRTPNQRLTLRWQGPALCRPAASGARRAVCARQGHGAWVLALVEHTGCRLSRELFVEEFVGS